MEQIIGFDQINKAKPVAALNGSTQQNPQTCTSNAYGLQGALSLVSQDLVDLGPKEIVETITSLMQLAGALGHNKVVLEGIELLSGGNSPEAISGYAGKLQKMVADASRQAGIVAPEWEFEVRGSHVDMRISLDH